MEYPRTTERRQRMLEMVLAAGQAGITPTDLRFALRCGSDSVLQAGLKLIADGLIHRIFTTYGTSNPRYYAAEWAGREILPAVSDSRMKRRNRDRKRAQQYR
mgnify:FL=1